MVVIVAADDNSAGAVAVELMKPWDNGADKSASDAAAAADAVSAAIARANILYPQCPMSASGNDAVTWAGRKGRRG